MSPIYTPGKLVLKKDSVATDPNTDPNIASVSLLLSGNGINGSTSIIDSSPSPKTVTAVGDAQISTAQSKFGGASILFDGTGDYLTTPSDSSIHVLGSDFTLEAWIRTGAAQNDFTILSTYNDAGGDTVGYIARLASTTFRWFAGKGGALFVLVDRTFAFTSGQWYHVAVTSSGNVGRIFIDGNLQGATFDNSGTVNSTQTLQVGRVHTGTADFNGYIDDLRITKGVARYTANFTPPTLPFPNY